MRDVQVQAHDRQCPAQFQQRQVGHRSTLYLAPGRGRDPDGATGIGLAGIQVKACCPELAAHGSQHIRHQPLRALVAFLVTRHVPDDAAAHLPAT
jgi:hypothetical protein